MLNRKPSTPGKDDHPRSRFRGLAPVGLTALAIAATLLGIATPAIIGANGAAASAATVSAAALPADTSGFHGYNWARQGDNFTPDPLVLLGLNLNDSYATVAAKADGMLTAFASTGANTVRLPVNPATTNTNTATGPDWWDSYQAVIDTATARGFKVVLGFWNEETPDYKIANISAFNTMWDIIVAKYNTNPLVYFDVMNEPVGYTTAEWETIAAKWLTDRPTVPRSRVILAGGGWDWDTLSLCHDTRFDGTLLAFHHYAWNENITTYSGWVSKFKSYIGDCAARTILEEFGTEQDTHLNFTDPTSTDKQVVFMRALTDSVRDLHMGSIYWSGIGGRNIRTDSVGPYESLTMLQLFSSTTNLPLRTLNPTGLSRLQYSWGIGNGTSTGTLQIGTDKTCLDVPRATQNNVQVQTWVCNGGSNQQWSRNADGTISVYNGAKCLDAYAGGSANGTVVGTWPCHGGTNQQWSFYSDGTIRNVASGQCLDLNTSNHLLQLWGCRAGSNQQWAIV